MVQAQRVPARTTWLAVSLQNVYVPIGEEVMNESSQFDFGKNNLLSREHPVDPWRAIR